MIKDVEARLLHWANWQQKYQDQGRGYPSAAALTQVAMSNQAYQLTILHSDPLAEEMEAWLVQLGQAYPKLAEAILMQYLETGLMRGKAARLNQSYELFKRQLDQGKYWLAGRLFEQKCQRKIKV